MNTHTIEIIQKMKDSIYPELNGDFIVKLTNESERGAVLIGTTLVEDYMNKLASKVLPKKSKSYTNRLLKYPGALSSFSGKIELLFAFRLIDENFYNSLNFLRKLRNEAAHSSNDFRLENYKEKLICINEFNEGFSSIIDKLALDNLIKLKKMKLKKLFNEQDLEETTSSEMWKEVTDNLEENPDILKQLQIWTLSYGLTFICLKIMVLIEKYIIFEDNDWTFLNMEDKTVK